MSYRPKGDFPLTARPYALRPRGGHGRRGAGHVPHGQGPHGSGFGSYFLSGPHFPSCGDRFPSGLGMGGVFSNTSYGQMPQHWFYSRYPNPSVVPFAHPVSLY
jgi:hypothetical protein